ncbi:MAG: polymer-forming cytoskeletal protein [Gammaproteobacteria bacterium]|jgi:cytoskeletal protein CcmA (bactofilin family)
MALWKDPVPAAKPGAAPAPFGNEAAARNEAEPAIDRAPAPAPATSPAAGRAQAELKESLIAADLTIEGKIDGAGHVRIAGKFKGDVNVQGNLTIEPGAKVTGGVRAEKVVIAGELEGNVESARQVELLSGGVLSGDLKAGALTVASGARMRGQVEFGWDDAKSGKARENGSAA